MAQGRDLLKDKRTALVREFRQHRVELLEGLERLRHLAIDARRHLDDATAVRGPEPLASGALVAASGIDTELRSRTVAGVRVFDLRHDPVSRSPATRGWSPVLASVHLDTVALAYEELLGALLDLCAVELSVRRLATEIARTTKQVNALENVVLPQLRSQARRISLTLDEREREEHARLRRARNRRAARSASGQRPDLTRGVA